MELREFIRLVDGFEQMLPREKIILFAWFLHTYRAAEIFGNGAIRDCFQELDLIPPDTSVYLPRLARKSGRNSPCIIPLKGGYKLEGALRRSLDARYGEHPSITPVAKLLTDLPAKLPDLKERAFLVETLNCYRVKAFRAAVVMAWNLAYDHLVRWILADASRIQSFSAAMAKRYPKRVSNIIQKRVDFEEFREFETVEILATSNLVSKNTADILRDKLKRRNMAAHPSELVVAQSQADDAITDLVINVIYALT